MSSFGRDIPGIRNQRFGKGVCRKGNRSQELPAKWKGRDAKEREVAIVTVLPTYVPAGRWVVRREEVLESL